MKVEELLKAQKDYIDQIEVPEELEDRLRIALNRRTKKDKKPKWITRIAVLLILITLIGYNFDTLAFYGKRLMGYDKIMSGTLKELNELGKGQIINKGYTFENGVKITLDGIMIDENQLLAFYTIEDPKGNVDDYMPIMSIKGLFGTYNSQSGYGQRNEEGTIMKNIHSFEPPLFFEKTLHLKINIIKNGFSKEGEITFKIDRNKAMGYILKNKINKSVKIKETNIKFDNIVVSPTKTVVYGTIQNIFGLGMDYILGEKIIPFNLEIKLIANGRELGLQGGGMSTNMKGMTFHKEYDTLPQELHSLQILIERLLTNHDVNLQREISIKTNNLTINIENQNILINKVIQSNGNTLVTITTEKEFFLSEVYLIVDGKRVELEETLGDNYEKLKEGKLLHTRTLKFTAIGRKNILDIRGITYPQEYNRIIDIPID